MPAAPSGRTEPAPSNPAPPRADRTGRAPARAADRVGGARGRGRPPYTARPRGAAHPRRRYDRGLAYA
jgi:hypothetical protein